MTEKEMTVISTMVDDEFKLKVPSVFSYFQDIAFEDAEKIGLGKGNTFDQGKSWIFTRIKVEFDAYPKFLDRCIALTYPKETKVFTFPRQFRISDLNGKPLVRLSSLWALIDSSSRHLLFKPGLPEVEAQEREDELPLPSKTTAKPASFVYKKTIRHSDIDINGHLNNVRYVESVIDVHSMEFYHSHEIKHFLINFIKEVHEGEELNLYKSEDGTYVKGEVNGILCFEANLEYRDI